MALSSEVLVEVAPLPLIGGYNCYLGGLDAALDHFDDHLVDFHDFQPINKGSSAGRDFFVASHIPEEEGFAWVGPVQLNLELSFVLGNSVPQLSVVESIGAEHRELRVHSVLNQKSDWLDSKLDQSFVKTQFKAGVGDPSRNDHRT